jgi:hypothetical protein
MSKFAGESANLSKNVRLIRNLSKVRRKRLRNYLIFIPLLSGWADSIKESALFLSHVSPLILKNTEKAEARRFSP